MLGERADIRINSRPIRYSENGFRTVTAEETVRKIENLFLTTGFEITSEQIWVENTPLSYYIFHFLSPEGSQADKIYIGKGFSENQCTASAAMEFVERFCAQRFGDEPVVEASYNQLKDKARDPSLFILPGDSCYTPDLQLEWIWGYSLTYEEPVLVPANFIFLPYTAGRPSQYIADFDSNGLATGNCLEEAILHGLLEVVERDARMIIEYNRLVMPDLEPDLADEEPLARFFGELSSCAIKAWAKNIATDIPIPSIGIFLKGNCKNKPVYSYAAGCYLSPRIALSRALTEALQLYPRCENYKQWLNSGHISYLYDKSEKRIKFSALEDLSSDDLKENILSCVAILKEFEAEVIVVDLSRKEMVFPVVRVCVTNLQPVVFGQSPRLSQRIFEVPLILGHRNHALKPEDIKPRNLCGMMWKK